MNWLKELKTQVHFKEPLSCHTALGIGGPADIWVEPNNYLELKEIFSHCLRKQIPYIVIGKGSNILVGDRGFKGIAISLSSPYFTRTRFDKNFVTCGAGTSLKKLVSYTRKKGLNGLEFLAGIPSTVGGALIMNAGGQKRSIGHLAQSVKVIDRKGNIRILRKNQLKFGYRQSNLSRYIVLEATFKLKKKSPEEVKRNIARFLEIKRNTQDLTSKSAGCIFKNPHHCLTAGQMIEGCGLKGIQRGGTEISTKHANYIINRSGAKAKDMLYLIRLIQREVRKKYGVNLEPEIKIVT